MSEHTAVQVVVKKVLEKESSTGKPMLSILLADDTWRTTMKFGYGGKENGAYKSMLANGPGAYYLEMDDAFVRKATPANEAGASVTGNTMEEAIAKVERQFPAAKSAGPIGMVAPHDSAYIGLGVSAAAAYFALPDDVKVRDGITFANFLAYATEAAACFKTAELGASVAGAEKVAA